MPVPVAKQWLNRHQTGVKESSGSGQAIVRQWLDIIFGQISDTESTIVHWLPN